MTHRAEIERWAKCPDGTRVYRRLDKGLWKLEIKTQWLPNETYVVDDAYERARRHLIDYGFIWFNSSLHGWVKVNNIFDINPAEKYAVEKPDELLKVMFDVEIETKKELLLLHEHIGGITQVKTTAESVMPEKTTKEKHDEDMAEYFRSQMVEDNVRNHEKAEEILLNLLKDMGYNKLVEAFNKEAERFGYE